MERTILLQKNASVVTPSSRQVGSLERVVLNPETKVVTDIVIQAGSLLKKDYRVVPMDWVAETNENQILLHNEAEGLVSFPPFEERRIVAEGGEQPDSSESRPPIIYGVPGVGPAIPPTVQEEPVITQIEQNIPEGTVALKEGAKVITSDDKHIGNVERVLVDPAVQRVTHLIISQGLLMKDRQLISMRWVTSLGEDTVRLGVTDAEIKALESDSPLM